MTLLYNDTVELEFTAKGHKYTVNGERVANVTSVLGVMNKPALVGWAAKETALYWENLIPPGRAVMFDEVEIAEHVKSSKSARFKKSGKALMVGNIVHEFAENYAKGENPSLPTNPQAKAGCEAFLAWWEAHDIEVIAVERKILSLEHGFCGTVDLICLLDGELTIIDYKTSTGFWEEYDIQVAGAYRIAYEEEMGDEVKRCMVVRFDKETGEFETKEIGEFDAHKEAFLACLTIYNYQKRK